MRGVGRRAKGGWVHRILIVEDTDEEAEKLGHHLERYASEHDEKFDVHRVSSAAGLVDAATGADLLFMDVSLPGSNGMDAAGELRRAGIDTPIVFVTNLAQYAMRGYTVDALGFVVKSSSFGDFSLCMDRAMRSMALRSSHDVTIPTAGGVRVVDTGCISRVESQRRDLVYHIDGTAPLRVAGELDAIGHDLAQAGAPFVRASAGCLVNMTHIKLVRGNDLLLTDGATVTLGRLERGATLAAIAEYLGGMA